MFLDIDDLLEFVFDKSFEKKKPELAKKIREEEMYRVLVEEIQALKEEFQNLEEVKEELRKQTEKAKSQVSKILTNKQNGRLF